jgi:thiamine transporter ThiT
MSLKECIQISLLLAIGTVLHLIVPGYGSGMKPDILLGMFFIVLLLYRGFKVTMVASLVAGVLSAITTTFPGGQIPNLIDKMVTGLILYLVIRVLANRVPQYVMPIVIGILGTLISGSVFLGSAMLLVGLPAPFMVLFTAVVLPTIVLNTIAMVVLYPVVTYSKSTVEGLRKV